MSTETKQAAERQASALLREVHHAHMQASQGTTAGWPEMPAEKTPGKRLAEALSALNGWLNNGANPMPEWSACPTVAKLYFRAWKEAGR